MAGDLAAREDTFTTRSGKEVKLRIWVQKEDLPKTEWAMVALKKSMKWDEDTFGEALPLLSLLSLGHEVTALCRGGQSLVSGPFWIQDVRGAV